MPEESEFIIDGIRGLAIDPPMVVSHPNRRSSNKMPAMLDEVRIVMPVVKKQMKYESASGVGAKHL